MDHRIYTVLVKYTVRIKVAFHIKVAFNAELFQMYGYISLQVWRDWWESALLSGVSVGQMCWYRNEKFIHFPRYIRVLLIKAIQLTPVVSRVIQLQLACRPGQPAEARPVHLPGALRLVRAGNVTQRRVDRPPCGLKARHQLDARPDRGPARELEYAGRWPPARPPTRWRDRSKAGVDERWSEFPRPVSGEFDSKWTHGTANCINAYWWDAALVIHSGTQNIIQIYFSNSTF